MFFKNFFKKEKAVKLDNETINTLAAMYESTSQEDRFFYSDSIDEYLLGRQNGDLFYAGYVPSIGWVWHYSIDTPWGEERPGKPGFYYPSLPREVDFITWINGLSIQLRKQAYEVVEEQLTALSQKILDFDSKGIRKDKLIDKILSMIDDSSNELKEILYSSSSEEKE